VGFQVDTQELKRGLVIFRRTDVKHPGWYCRVRLPEGRRYKTIALKTSHLAEAREQAFTHDAEINFRLKHGIPVFEKTFGQAAEEFSAAQKERSEAGEISYHRWRVMKSHIKTQLIPYVGSVEVTSIGEERWKGYPAWRQKTGKGRSGGRVSDGTIRDEMATFRAIMSYAATKHYIRGDQVSRARLPVSKARREEFTPAEYRQLHRFARKWITEARNATGTWYRTMAYNFVLIMTNTGMRPSEARNLRWRDVSIQSDSQRRQFVRLNVRGKGKFRSLVAANNVATYLERVKEISGHAEPDDYVFCTENGEMSRTLYYSLIERLLIDSGLQASSSGARRSTYCFRHTYATFRLTEGVDVYFLAKQMGTSVKMIEDHYGHIIPVKNADRILLGLQGWQTGQPDMSRSG
jgi:integrase